MLDYQINFCSSVLGKNIRIRCLIPNGSSLKCLILLHGYNGDQNQWCKQSCVSALAEQHNLAVVMPSCGDGYYEDTQEDIPRFVGEELVAYLRSVFPLSGSKDDLYIGGVSMGGFGALLIGSKYYNTFGKIASFSGAFIIPDVVIGNPGVLGNADVNYFRKVFGDFESLEGSRRDPVAETIHAASQGCLPALFLLCGTDDVLYQGNLKVVKVLRNAGIPVLWYDGTGGHQWPFWNDMLPHVIRWLVEDFVPEGVDNGHISSNN